MKLYPAIDLINSHVVRLTQGRFDEVTEYSQDPVEVALGFANAGAQCLHVVDLDGAREGKVQQATTINRIVRACRLEVQVGGGIRTIAQSEAFLSAGARRVVVGSLALKDPLAMEALIAAVGSEQITLALDFRRNDDGEALVTWAGWKETGQTRVEDLIERYARLGVMHVLCTDVSRDGTLRGPEVTLYQRWQERYPNIEVQVSGGIGNLTHVKTLKAMGSKAVILGKALYEGSFRLEEALQC
jgi:phosphoribosylformimino-5-aminoimidazole carboxamide ribotide isomerase